jgi:LmbE family N-acetylglucosaminyl deacetylase
VRVLHLAPHPDDEVLGAGATLLALAAAGHEVTNLAVSLGRRSQRSERRAELEDACAELELPLEVLDPPLAMSVGEGDDLGAARMRLVAVLGQRLDGCDLVIAPSPHDAHPGHGLVGSAVVEAAGALAEAPRLWLWSLWSSLPVATTVTAFGEAQLSRLETALLAHRSQLERNDYRRLLRAKASLDAVLGPERIAGFAAAALERPYAELTCELVGRAGRWLLGAPRTLDPGRPCPPPTDLDAARWLATPPARELLAKPD